MDAKEFYKKEAENKPFMYGSEVDDCHFTKREMIRFAEAYHKTKTDIQIDKIIERLGLVNDANEYRIRPDHNGKWWIEHNEVKSAEPLRQWLKNKL